jgi:signal peptidase II
MLLEPPLAHPADDTSVEPGDVVVEPTVIAPPAEATAPSAELLAAADPLPPTEPAPAAPPARGPGLYWALVAGLIVIDQVTKVLLRSAVPLFDSRPIINGLLDFVHVRNEGVAFGLLNTLDLQNKWILTTALASAALAGIAYYARHIRPEERLARIGLSMILGGAIGNLIDRVYAGYVLDFIDVYWGEWHFWAFNVADASISIGAVLVFVDLLLVKPHASNPV